MCLGTLAEYTAAQSFSFFLGVVPQSEKYSKQTDTSEVPDFDPADY